MDTIVHDTNVHAAVNWSQWLKQMIFEIGVVFLINLNLNAVLTGTHDANFFAAVWNILKHIYNCAKIKEGLIYVQRL